MEKNIIIKNLFMPCFFCDIQIDIDKNIILKSKSFFARLDDFPVSPGHTEIVPKNHIATIFELEKNIFPELMDILIQTKSILDKQFEPDGYNIGINQGVAAGQSIPHLHIHIIPRYEGDVRNPRGGVRNIFPNKADYTDDASKKGREKYIK